MAIKVPGMFLKPYTEKALNHLFKYLEQIDDIEFLKSCFVFKPGNEEEKTTDAYVIKDDLGKDELKKLKTLAKAITINKKGPVRLIPIFALGALIAGAFFYFSVLLDPLLSKYLTSALEEVFEAKVEVRGFHLSLHSFRVSIRSLTVANRDRPMTNLFETERLEIYLLPQAALSGKIYIEEIRTGELQFGTARQTSGALPRFAARVVERREKPPSPPLIDLAQLDARGLLEREYNKLQSPKAYDAAIAAYNEAKTRWENQYGSATAKVKDVQTRSQPLLAANIGNLRTAEEITAYVADVNAFIKTLENARDEVHTIVNGVQRDINTALELERMAVNAINADLNHLKNFLDLSSGSALEALEPTIREILYDEVEEYFMYARRAMESLEKVKALQAMIPKSEPKPDDALWKGRDVHFPTPAYPKFYLGIMASDFTQEDWNYAFDVRDVSSDPDITNRTTNLNLGLSEMVSARRTVHFAGTADFRTNAQTYFTANLAGNNFSMNLRNRLAHVGIGGISGGVAFSANLSGRRSWAFGLDGDIHIRNTKIYDPRGTIAEAIVEALTESPADFPAVELGVQYEYRIDDRDTFKLTANIGDLIMNAIKRTVQRYLRQAQEAIERALRERIEQYLTGKWVSKEEVDLIFAAVKGDHSALDVLKSNMEAKRDEAEQKIRGQVDEAVDKAKEEARTQVQDAARGALERLPFGRN